MNLKLARDLGRLAGRMRKRAQPQSPMAASPLTGMNPAMATGYGAGAAGLGTAGAGAANAATQGGGQANVFRTMMAQRAKTRTAQPQTQMPNPGMAVANKPQLPVTPMPGRR